MKKQSNIQDQQLPLLKIIIVGESAVGKSNILSRFVFDKFYIGINTTIGLQFVTKKFRVYNEQVNLQIWDTAGQQKFRALNRAFYRNALGGIMVFSLGDRKSFQKLPKWIQQVKQGISENPVIILVGNKCDLKEQQVTVSEATQFAKNQKMAYFQTSAALNINIEKIFEVLANKLYEVYKSSDRKVKRTHISTIISQVDASKKRQKQKCCE